MVMAGQSCARRPVIGLPIGRALPEHPEYLRVRETYPRAIAEAGGLPVILPPLEDAQALRQLFEMLDGIVFPGGLDVHPSHYGEAHVHPATEVDPALDTLELRLAEWAVSSDIPTLGICRGQQLLNVALGGTLLQDLPSERLPAGVAHRQAGQRRELSHTIRVEGGSRLAGILGSTTVEVNSFHHQAVRCLGGGLRAVAWSPDGIIEGVEGTDHPWLMAVQFHPEDLVPFHDPSRRLFRALVRACEQGMHAPRAAGIQGGRRAIL